MSSCSRDPVLLAGRAGTEPAANPWDSSRGRPAGAHGWACPCPNKALCSPPLRTWPFFWGCCWPHSTEVGPTGLLDGSTTDGSTIGDGTRVAQHSTGTTGGALRAAPGRRGAPQEGIYCFNCRNAEGLGQTRAGSLPLAAPEAEGRSAGSTQRAPIARQPPCSAAPGPRSVNGSVGGSRRGQRDGATRTWAVAAGAPAGRVRWERRGPLAAGGGRVRPGGHRARSGASSHR